MESPWKNALERASMLFNWGKGGARKNLAGYSFWDLLQIRQKSWVLLWGPVRATAKLNNRAFPVKKKVKS